MSRAISITRYCFSRSYGKHLDRADIRRQAADAAQRALRAGRGNARRTACSLARTPRRCEVREAGIEGLANLAAPQGNGMSSETLLFDVHYRDQGAERTLRCVGRLPPDAGAIPVVFPEYDLLKQYRVMEIARERSTAPVPRMLWYEGDESHLGAPFFVMERADGEAPPDVPPYVFESWGCCARSRPSARGCSTTRSTCWRGCTRSSSVPTTWPCCARATTANRRCAGTWIRSARSMRG